MTWSSVSGSARRRALVVVVPLLLAACSADVEVIETQMLVVAGSGTCSAAARDGQRANRYLMSLMQYPPGVEGADADDACIQCLVEGSCIPQQTRCICGPRRPVGTRGLNLALGDVRFEDLDPTGRYCVVLLAWDDAAVDVPREEGERACDCPRPGGTPSLQPRLCGLSPWAGAVDENASALVVLGECDPNCALFAPYRGSTARP